MNTRKTPLLLLFTILLTSLTAQDQMVKAVGEKLEHYQSAFPLSKTVIKTDKDIYAPGEKIWFDITAFNSLLEQPAGNESIVLMLKQESGEVIVDAKYLLQEGKAGAFLTIPGWAPEGNAYLIAYPPRTLVINEASLAAIQPVLINALKKNDYLLSAQLDKKHYKTGDEVKMQVKLSPISQHAKKEKISFTLFDYQHELYSIKENIVVGQTTEFRFKLPSNIENGLFFQIVTTGKNSTASKKVPVRTSKDRLSIEFFPEGETLLSNTIQRITYRATDPFGKTIDVHGKIVDAMHNEVGLGKMLSNGVGMINLMPMPDQKYQFIVQSDYGKGQSFDLPGAVIDGSAFSLVKTEDATLRVAISNGGKMLGEHLTVLAISKGTIVNHFSFDAKNRNLFSIATKDLPTGIIQFVVLNKQLKVLSQRLIYNIPYRDIDISIATQLHLSQNNGEANIQLDLSNFMQHFGPGTVDLKVVDQQNLCNNEVQPQAHFLAYPLQNTPPKTVLDIFLTNIELIANRYKYHNFQDLLNGVDYGKSKEGGQLSGTVIDKNGCRIPNATIMVDHPNHPSLASARSDENGRFSFSNIGKAKEMNIKAVSENGKKNYLVQLDRSFDETLDEIMLIQSFGHSNCYHNTTSPAYFEQNQELLKKVGSENRDKRPASPSNAQKMLSSGASLLDVIKMLKPFSIVSNQIVFYGSTNSINNQQGALIVIDGQKMGTSISALEQVNPFDVVSVNISTNPSDIQRYTGLNSIGIIEIKTGGSMNSEKQRQAEETEHLNLSFQQSDIAPDIFRYHTTLHWETGIPTPPDGIISRNIQISELKTEFVIQVEITSADGIVHRQLSTFSTIDN